MATDPATLNAAWARLIIDAAVRGGVTHVFISPGSRSTPLTLAAVQTPGLPCTLHIDERGAAFAAQAYARAGSGLAALICTSGTAAVNYFPAVVEASMAGVPLLLLTADRPPELRGTGANQTIDQVRLYGDYARHFHDLPCPDPALAAALPAAVIAAAVRAAHGTPAGPVHINCMFREPLSGPDAANAPDVAHATRVFSPAVPELPTPPPLPTTPPPDWAALVRDLAAAERPLLVLGELRDAAGVRELVQALGLPTLADVTSGLHASDLGDLGIPLHDLLLNQPAALTSLAPDCVVHIGGRVTSKVLGKGLNSWTCPYWRLRVPGAPRPDAAHDRTMRVLDATPLAMRRGVQAAGHRGPGVAAAPQRLRLAGLSLIGRLADPHFPEAELSEMNVARSLASLETDGPNAFYLSASLPIRLMDVFVTAWGTPPDKRHIEANRGASGIDGVLSSACGYALGLARRYAGPVPLTLLIGDLALLHDLNALALARRSAGPLVIVLLNNDGGGIFELLPVRQEAPELFEPWFGTPHGMDFSHAAQQFGIAYTSPETLADFRAAYAAARRRPGVTLIEVRCRRERTAALWRQAKALAADVCAALT